MTTKLFQGDCREALRDHAPFDLIIADPPYGDTSLGWDKRCDGWLEEAIRLLKPNGSLWVFGSMRFLLDNGPSFRAAGLRFTQDIVWEKHNGSGFHADRFKRVHEHVVQFYRDGAKWSDVYNDVQTTPDATAKTARRKLRPTHMGQIERGHFVSQDGGPRLMRSVIQVRSCHGYAIHPTQKPVELLEILIRTSCPENGSVGDMFAGSGAVGVACLNAGRAYVGVELDAAMALKASERLSKRDIAVTEFSTATAP